MMKTIAIAVAAVATPVCSACGAADVDRATRTDSAGVALVVNTGVERAITADFRRGLELGGEAEGPASFYEVDPVQVAVTPTGAVAVLDRPGSRVSVFDSTGTALATFGREGDGPGEFRYPVSIASLGDGRFAVYDYQKQALQYFTSDGTFVDQHGLTVPFNGYGMLGTPTGMVLYSQSVPRGDGEFRRRVMHLSADDTVQLGPEASSQASFVFYESCGVRLTQPPVFAAELVWASNGPRTVVAAGPEYSVQVFDGPAHAATIRRELSPEPATPETLARVLGDGEEWGVGGRTCVVPPAEVIEQRGHGAFIPLIEALAVTPSNEVWVKRRTVGAEERRIDIFAEDGEYRGSIPGESPFPIAFLPDGQLLTIEADSFDVERLVHYSVTFDPPA